MALDHLNSVIKLDLSPRFVQISHFIDDFLALSIKGEIYRIDLYSGNIMTKVILPDLAIQLSHGYKMSFPILLRSGNVYEITLKNGVKPIAEFQSGNIVQITHNRARYIGAIDCLGNAFMKIPNKYLIKLDLSNIISIIFAKVHGAYIDMHDNAYIIRSRTKEMIKNIKEIGVNGNSIILGDSNGLLYEKQLGGDCQLINKDNFRFK